MSGFAGSVPDWPAPPVVRALQTWRYPGDSRPPYDGFNLALHVGDDPRIVHAHRGRLQQGLGLAQPPAWLEQVHGAQIVAAHLPPAQPPVADGAWTDRAGMACAVLTADCLPVLLCDDAGRCVAAAHAGWRGLRAGVIEAAVAALPAPPAQLLAWLGAAIGPEVFEVGAEVRDSFIDADPRAADAFVPGNAGRWLADLYQLARLRLRRCGVTRISGGTECTFSQPARYYSYRRDGRCGRMASLIWIAPQAPAQA